MTGGVALIIGKTGRNFAAGMSGGIALIYDADGTFVDNCNQEMVDLDPLSIKDEELIIKLLKKHYQLTQSTVAKFLVESWKDESSKFIKVFPKEFKKVLSQKQQLESIY
jgi:glutamate synthase (NADPH/NADH) large chain